MFMISEREHAKDKQKQQNKRDRSKAERAQTDIWIQVF